MLSSDSRRDTECVRVGSTPGRRIGRARNQEAALAPSRQEVRGATAR